MRTVVDTVARAAETRGSGQGRGEVVNLLLHSSQFTAESRVASLMGEP